jgi:hypothetical protein
MRKLFSIPFVVATLVLGSVAVFTLRAADKPAVPGQAMRYFEMRTYHAPAGKLDALNARFRDHTLQLFKKHDIESIGYWTPATGDAAQTTLVYLLAYPSKEACDASWKAFRADPDWIKAKDESEKDGKLVEKVDQLFLNPTDYSPIK